jgi:hypothetical protein
MKIQRRKKIDNKQNLKNNKGDKKMNYKKNTNIYNPMNLFKILLFYTAALALQDTTPFKDGNITVHSLG